MSASKFFRNFLTLPQMGAKDKSCHQTRENVHRNDDPKIEKTRGISLKPSHKRLKADHCHSSASHAPESECKSEILDPLSIAHGSYRHQETVSQVASMKDVDQNLNDEHGMQEVQVCRNLRVVDTITAEDIDRHFCGTEDKGRVQVNTTIRGEEVKNESTDEYEHRDSSNTETEATNLGPVGFTSLQAMAYGSLKECKTEEELEVVIAPAGVVDKLNIQNYMNTLNVTAKTNDLEDSHKAASVNGEQQEHLDFSLTDVSFPETIEERHDYCLQESVMQNVKPEQRLSTDHQNSDSADRGKEFSLIMGHECDFQQTDNSFQSEPSLPMAPCRLATSFPVSELSYSKSGLVNGFERSSDNVYSKIVSESRMPIMSVLRISNAKKTKSNESEANGNSSKSVNGKRISVAAGIVYEDQVSSVQRSQCSTTIQTLISSDYSEVARNVPSSSFRHSVNNRGTSPSFGNRAHPEVFSKLPPDDFFNHSKVHKEDACRKDFMCNICKKVFMLPSTLKLHMMIHSGVNPLKRLLGGEQVDTVTNIRPICLPGREKETNTAEDVQSSLSNTQIHANVVCPVEFTSLQAMADGSLKDEKTEEEVVAPTDIFDELFKECLNELNVTSKANDLEEARRAACVDVQQQEHFDVPVVVISEQETRMKDCENRFPESVGQKKFPAKERRYSSNNIHTTIVAATAEHLCEPTEIVDGQHETNYENIDTSSIDTDRVHVEPSTERQSENINVASMKIGHDEAVVISDDDCISIASSSNSEIYEEGDCEDIEINEEETQESINKGDVDNLAASADVRFQFPSQGKSNKTEEKTIEEFFLSVNNCTASVDELSNNSGHIDTNNLPIQLEDSQIQKILSLIMVSSRSAETTSGSHLRSCSNSELQRSSDNLQNKVLSESSVAIVGESRIANSMKTKSYQNESKDYSSNVMMEKRISVGAGIVYEASPETFQSSTMTQTLLPSFHQKEAREVPSSSSSHCITNPSTSSSFWNHVDPLVLSKLPSGATLVSDRGIFDTKDMERPFACGYCGRYYKNRDAVFSHIIQQHDEKPRFSCEICGKRFGDQYHLSRHLATHSSDKPFCCHICGMRFRLKTDLCYHNLRHPKEKPDFVSHSKVHSEDSYREDVVCNICKMVFTLPSALKQHMMIHFTEKSFSYEEVVSSTESSQCSVVAQTLFSSDHSESSKIVPASFTRQANDDHGTSSTRIVSKVTSKLPPGSTSRGLIHTKDKENPFACGYCGKAYKCRKSVYGHITLQHDEKRFSCEFCGKRFAQESDLSNHVTMHTKEKPFTCNQCGMRFRLKGNLRRHKYTHSEERLFSCNKCRKSFKTRDDLSRHKESHNKDEQRKGVICNICKRKFRYASDLKHHMTIHTGEKPYKCSFCEKQYRLKVELRYHMNTHSGKKRLADKTCSVCGKAIGANYLSTHMRMHTGEKPFECNICKKRFPKKINLEGHMRSHTGEKPFECSGCDKRFALYSNMMTHKEKCMGSIHK